jgi:hypothetical protein
LDERCDPDRHPRRNGDADAFSQWGYSKAGRQDLERRKDYHPEKHDAYEDGDHGYHKSHGDKNRYKELYRRGFMRGYQDAFNRQ